ncbi:MAG: hypothetical protein HUU35_09450 [Armatimonadetes bacterium]|nr:hypothetical protein [Armatimonadota bacterium]
MRDVNLAEMRQHYRAAVVDSEEHAQRLVSLGAGAAAAVLLMTSPALGSVLPVLWLAMCGALMTGAVLYRRRFHQQLREALLEQQLQMHTRIDRELWDRIGQMRPLPQPLQQYVEHFLATYNDFKQQVNEDSAVELGQVQLIQARDQVLEFLDLAERTGRIREVLDTQSHRLADEDQMRLRQLFSEQCAGLQDLAQTFDRSLGNLVVAQVLGSELGETRIQDVAERMREIEEEFEHVKQSLTVDS